MALLIFISIKYESYFMNNRLSILPEKMCLNNWIMKYTINDIPVKMEASVCCIHCLSVENLQLNKL